MPTPIAVFAFNRPDHLRRTLDALAANDLAAESDVTIFCDGPRSEAETEKTTAVRNVAKAAQGFASLTIVERDKNLGCAAAVIDGLTQMFAQQEKLIVIEDDILTSPYTLRYLNTALDKYADNPVIFNIAAWSPPPSLMPVPPTYPYDAYCIPRFNCWGWASWRDRWQKVELAISDYELFKAQPTLQTAFNKGGRDLTPMLRAQMEGDLETWDILVDYARFKQGCVGLNPIRAYTTNIGMGSGTHTVEFTTRFDNDITQAVPNPNLPEHIFVDDDIAHAYREACAPSPPTLPVRVVNKIRRILSKNRLFTSHP
ncbi:hypothetical protein [Desulfovibrio sp.]|uniref:hypothetical protein n=1 Tax=Desulfovibrio sp. TaxID=885 RepID=UPI003D0CFCB9